MEGGIKEKYMVGGVKGLGRGAKEGRSLTLGYCWARKIFNLTWYPSSRLAPRTMGSRGGIKPERSGDGGGWRVERVRHDARSSGTVLWGSNYVRQAVMIVVAVAVLHMDGAVEA
jgi:hypothetical protein